MIESICDSFDSRCTGCEACMRACPRSCIEMVPDKEGFAYPSIDNFLCISCEACVRACPNNMDVRYEDSACAWAFQEQGDFALRSSSGGAFHALGLDVLARGGVAYGFAFNGCDLVMRRADKAADLDKLRGSKYVQGSIGDSFDQIERDAVLGLPIVVCGTACQIAGIRSSLSALRDKVLLIDLVCHGVPSPAMFERHVRYLEKRFEDDLIEYSFRDKKTTHWLMSKHFRYRFARRDDVEGNWKADAYYNAYLKALTMRECCYRCPYSTVARCSDLTLCDFWGVDRASRSIDQRLGVSAFIAHTDRGRAAAERLEAYGVMHKIEVDDILKGNPNLERPTNRPAARDEVYADISRTGYEAWAVRQVTLKDRIFAFVVDSVPLCAVESLQKLRDRKRARSERVERR
ncbi:Coenzyme F420 hydrogenase/dehydrogenase, beta subunit C-terminal domain [Eggerthella guodeyinii]|uniref:Coenzyme F420 hydrogenase/dehydrogenase, beta subunit C-terminal domain n=2 Tax=Eggerthella guodeyinii TaxID=2690837 RepID=A0A6L7IRN7_9ACTN|nr:Coenzyme F420 hydrogenase/dehydrogenase, beta subunit C-terminal domain [Eggerthella guodeyinii]